MDLRQLRQTPHMTASLTAWSPNDASHQALKTEDVGILRQAPLKQQKNVSMQSESTDLPTYLHYQVSH